MYSKYFSYIFITVLILFTSNITYLPNIVNILLNNSLFKILIFIIILYVYNFCPMLSLMLIITLFYIELFNYKKQIKEGFIEGIKENLIIEDLESKEDIDNEISSLESDIEIIND